MATRSPVILEGVRPTSSNMAHLPSSCLITWPPKTILPFHRCSAALGESEFLTPTIANTEPIWESGYLANASLNSIGCFSSQTSAPGVRNASSSSPMAFNAGALLQRGSCGFRVLVTRTFQKKRGVVFFSLCPWQPSSSILSNSPTMSSSVLSKGETNWSHVLSTQIGSAATSDTGTQTFEPIFHAWWIVVTISTV